MCTAPRFIVRIEEEGGEDGEASCWMVRSCGEGMEWWTVGIGERKLWVYVREDVWCTSVLEIKQDGLLRW